tara:strand:+ start:199 stop:1173 length:975 start_codon:yes stop_codon:yes gene_type:complete
MTNFDAGVLSRGVPAEGGSNLLLVGGNIFWVDSGHANTHADNPGVRRGAPLATIDQAINKCAASNGDLILVAEGHAESIANATTLVPDTAGVRIVGLGRGAARPTITFSHANGNIPISGAGVEFHNFYFTTTGTIDVVAGITVSAVDVLLQDCEMREDATDSQFVDAIVGTTCGRLEINNFKFTGLVAGDATQAAISITGTPAEVKIVNPWIVGEFVAAGIDISGVATQLFMKDLVIQQLHATQDACITVAGTATGFLLSPRLRTAEDNDGGITAAITAGSDLQIYDVRIVNADGEVDGASSFADVDVAGATYAGYGAVSGIAP